MAQVQDDRQAKALSTKEPAEELPATTRDVREVALLAYIARLSQLLSSFPPHSKVYPNLSPTQAVSAPVLTQY